MTFTLQGGKVLFKPDDEKNAKAGTGMAVKLNGERLVKLQGMLKQSGWVNPASKDSSESTKSWKEREAVTALVLKLLDFAIEQHVGK